jgi:hypothetical protein
MKRIKTPSIASIHLDDISHPTTPAGKHAMLTPHWLKESFSFITKAASLFNPFIAVSASLPGYNFVLKDFSTIRINVHFKS